MLLYSVFPYLNFLIQYSITVIKRCKDSGTKSFWGKHKNNFATKCKNPQQYIELYSGPNVMMNFKYSNVLNIVLVAFTHGTAIPILWPITLFGIFNNYFCERILFAYYYKQPPLFDNKLNDQALNILEKCPIIMMLLGYWYLGNRQIFFNKYSHLEDAQKEMVNPLHPLIDYREGVDHTLIMLLSVPMFIFYKQIISGITYILEKWFKVLSFEQTKLLEEKMDSIDEGLGDFNNCLKGIDLKKWYAEELYNKNKLNVHILDDKQLEMIRTGKRGRRHLINTPNYNILSNTIYAEKF